MFENFSIWYRNDPTATNKIAFFVGLAVFFPILLGGIWWINSPKNPVENTQIAAFVRPKITDKNFENSSQLELFDPEILGNTDIVFWQGGQVFSFNQSQNLKVDGQVLPGSPSFLPVSLYPSSGTVIINEQYQTTLFQNNNFTLVEKGIGQVLPFGGQFYYLFGSGNSRTLRSASNVNLSQNITTLGTITLPDVNSWAEIRAIGGKIFVLTYENSQKQGKVIVQKLESTREMANPTIEVVKIWENVQSLSFGNNILVTTSVNALENYQTKSVNVDDFSELILDNKKLKSLNVLGNFWANRCTFGQDIICLVKQDAVSTISANDPDKLIKIDKNGNMQIMFDSLVFSASYVFADGSNIFIVNPLKDLLYKIKL